MPNKEQTRTASLQEAVALLKLVRVNDDDTQETIDEFLDKMESPLVEIRTDTMPENPRVDCDNAGVMYCQHRRYNLGDKNAEDPFEEVEIYNLGGYEVEGNRLVEIMESLGDLCNHLQADEGLFIGNADYDKAEGAYHEIENDLRCQSCDRVERRLRSDIALCLPLYLYDHGGITMSHGAFGDPWDSGCVGAHYMTRKVLDGTFGGDEEKARACLEAELKTYDQYLQGNVWGFNIEDRSGAPLNSCWGFYGDTLEETGMLEHVEERLHKAMHEAWENRFA